MIDAKSGDSCSIYSAVPMLSLSLEVFLKMALWAFLPAFSMISAISLGSFLGCVAGVASGFLTDGGVACTVDSIAGFSAGFGFSAVSDFSLEEKKPIGFLLSVLVFVFVSVLGVVVVSVVSFVVARFASGDLTAVSVVWGFVVAGCGVFSVRSFSRPWTSIKA